MKLHEDCELLKLKNFNKKIVDSLKDPKKIVESF